MLNLLEALRGASAADPDTHRPVIFRADDPADRAALEDLLKREPRITVHDRLHEQLRDLVRTRHPAIAWMDAELNDAVDAHLGGKALNEYGNWVYYPWTFRLAHLLGETEFAQVRTDRNRNKITTEEQAALATKRVGVIGLSVGQSVSLALALERSFGELRLADFDTLELSNLNRVQSGVHTLGINKAVNTAREIAELDPYLRLTVYKEGITESNIEAFFSEGGVLDLVVEECDNVSVKISTRQRAKAYRIPVVMDTSDRGLIDVERFDLEPERPVMHGLLQDVETTVETGTMTPERSRVLAMAIAPPAGLSRRMRESLAQIGKSITTWPQLGSAVRIGGGVAADCARRVLLGEDLPSGRWYVDLDAMLTTGNSHLVQPTRHTA